VTNSYKVAINFKILIIAMEP